MALTEEQRNELLAVLERTGGHREVMAKTRVIPEEYKAYQSRCRQVEQTVAFPGLAPVRIIVTTPENKPDKAPLHVNYHGGGFIGKQGPDDDMYCAHLAVEAGAVVVDVDYAVSTEHPFPMAFHQSYEAAKWAFSYSEEWGCDPKRFSLGGSSAGGNLAAAVALKNTETLALPICLLALEYAANDNYMPIGKPGLERSEALALLYADGEVERLKDPFLSPCFASDEQLSEMPRTLIIAPKNCPFYEVNNAFGMRMVEAGVEVTFHAFPNALHGFTVRMLGEDWLQSQKDVIQAIQTARL